MNGERLSLGCFESDKAAARVVGGKLPICFSPVPKRASCGSRRWKCLQDWVELEIISPRHTRTE
jgi:hypothetical protein